MTRETVYTAIGNISDCYILEYAQYAPKEKKIPWRQIAAACILLAVISAVLLHSSRYIGLHELPYTTIEGQFSLTGYITVPPEGCRQAPLSREDLCRFFGTDDLPATINEEYFTSVTLTPEGTVHTVSVVFMGDDHTSVRVTLDPKGGESVMRRGRNYGGTPTTVKGHQVIYGKGIPNSSIAQYQFLWIRRGSEGIVIHGTAEDEGLMEEVYNLLLNTTRNYRGIPVHFRIIQEGFNCSSHS